jgi:ketosteroid isomerase-like protein
MMALALAAMLLAQPSEASPPRAFDRACMDEYARDLCDEAMRAEIRRRLGAEPAEDLARQGVEGVRVFMVDGYSRDMPMVSVLWSDPAATPVIETRSPSRDGFNLRTAPAKAWTAETTRTLMRLTRTSQERVERDPAPDWKDPTRPLTLCLHAWVSITEAIEAGKVHRRIRTACGDDPIFDGGFQLSTAALAAYDSCRALDGSLYRNDSARLGACATLEGDNPYNAAQIHNRLNRPSFDRPTATALDDLAAMMSPDLVVSWPDRPQSQGPQAIATAWQARTQGDSRARLWIKSVTGSERTVKVTGLMFEQRGDDQDVEAEFTQTWTKDKGFAWRLTEWTIQPFSKRKS